MADNKKPYHLTSIDLDVSGVQASLQKVQEDTQKTAEFIRKAMEEALKGFGNSEEIPNPFEGQPKKLNATKQQIESLNLSYKNFLNTLSKSKLNDSALNSILEEAKEAAKQMASLTAEVQKGTPITKEQTSEFNDLSSKLKTLKGDLKDADTNARETGEGFKTIKDSAEQAGNEVSSLLTRLSDKAKWMIAYQIVSLIQQAFGNVIGTIKTTEDAVVELQRVLNDDSLSNTTISDKLYDIAYRYGQSFENVQETAILFAQTGKDWNEVLQATEATMLGLNTAELDVTTATQGLIAVMAQFHVEADDLESVIDKINITADNFPVTSEKIVAALQRAGGTAYNFGLTLEETIGIITALSEATGRSGENIGTALNSLISFSMKESSLKKFSEFLGGMDLSNYDVLEIWQLLGAEIDKSGETLAKLMASSKEFEELFSEEMATAIGLTEEYNAAMMNSEDVYSTVGTYRQNYFIGLLNNISTAQEAIEGMIGAEGYSLTENEKYMKTLTAQWEQLVVSAQELAVAFGNAGFLELLKWITDATTSVLKLTKSVGGLTTIISGLATVFLAVKKSKFEEQLFEFNKNAEEGTKYFGRFRTAINTFVNSLRAGQTATEAFSLAMGTLKITTGDVIAIIGLAVTAFSAISGAVNDYKDSMKEARSEAVETGKESIKQAKEMFKAYDEYQKNKSDGSKRDRAKLDLFESLGYNEDQMKFILKDYDSLNEAIDDLMEKKHEQLKLDAEIAVHEAKNQWRDIELPESKDIVLDYEKVKNSLGDVRKELKIIEDEYSGFTLFPFLTERVNTVDKAKEKIKLFGKVIEQLKGNFSTAELAENKFYLALVNTQKAYQNWITTVEEAEYELEQFGEVSDETKEKLSGAQKEFEEAQESLDGMSESIEDAADKVKTLSYAFDEVSGKVDSFQSAYSSIVDIVEDYNETGILTADMLQTLLSMDSEYISLLDIKGGKLGINEEALGNLISQNDIYLQQLVALKAAEEAEAIAAEMKAAIDANLTYAEYEAGQAATVHAGELYELVTAMMSGTASAEDLANGLLNVGRSAGLSAGYLEAFKNKMTGILQSYISLAKLTQKGNLNTYWSPSSSGSSKEKERLNAEKKAWEEKKKSVKEYYDNLTDSVKKQKEESDKYYDSLIDSLKKQQEANDRINEQMDYYLSRQKILTNLEQAESRSGVEWREKEVEYQQDLIDLDEDWRRKQEDWKIDDQIDQLNEMKKAADEMFDAQIDNLKAMQEAAVSEIDTAIEKLNEQVQNLSKSISGGIGTGFKTGMDNAVAEVEEKSNRIEETLRRVSTERTEEYIKNRTKALAEQMNKMVTESVTSEARKLREVWQREFFDQINNAMQSIINQATSILNSGIARQNAQQGYYNKTYTNNTNLYANINGQSSANSTANLIRNGLRNPSRF